MKTPLLAKLLGATLLAGAGLSAFAADPIKVHMSLDEDLVVTRLAETLGYFKQEGIEIVPVDVTKFVKEDYLVQEPLMQGQVDAAEHWFNHTVFGARHDLPIKAVLMLNDAPAMKVMVANRVKDRVKSAADFTGLTIAEGAGYASKAVVTGYLAHKAGLPRQSYRPVNHLSENRLQLVLADLKADKLDVMTFQEPVTAGVLATGQVTTLYDLTTRAGTVQALGTVFPAQSILVSPQFIKDHPDTVQRLVNAYVRALRYVEAHSVDEVIAQLPAAFFEGKDRAAQINFIKATLPSLARGSYAFPAEAIHLVVDAMLWARFDQSEEGVWRASGDAAKVKESELYTNEFALRAMQAIPAAAKAAEPANAGVSIWTQNVTGFRKEHGVAGGYQKRWDLGEMPHYVPKQQVTGTLRIWGNNYIQDGDLGRYWREEFKKFQPGITLEYHTPTGTIAIPALACGVADLGLCYRARLTDLLVFEQVFHHPITEITALTGSYDVYGWSPATIIAVHRDNPLTQISMKQLDGVFGGARTGGYVGSVWHTEYPYSRGADENIRTWDQLGLTGEWAGKPIHTGGQNLTAGASYAFNVDVLRGSYQFAEGYQAFTNYITPDGKINSWSLQARRAIAKDKHAMFYVSPASLGPELKELAIQGHDGGPYVKRSLESIHDRTYPLYHEIFFYLNREPGQLIDPKVEEFLRFILSQEGQDCIQREGRYMPLLPSLVKEQLRKLD